MITHKKQYGIYHWDTFDNETFQVGEADTMDEAEKLVKNRYGNRLGGCGADRVDIVNRDGEIIVQYKVG